MVDFDTIHDLVHFAESPCDMPDLERSSITGNYAFTGTDTLSDAIALAKRGWDGGTAEIDSLRADLEHLLEGSIPILEPRFGIRGQRIHMGRYLTDRPDCFVSLVDSGLRLDALNAKIVHIVVNLAVSGSIGADVILRRGAAVIVLVDTLERRGVRCKIDLVHASQAKRLNATLETRVTVKQEYEPVSIGVLAFMLAHPSALRRILFAVREHESEENRKRFGIRRGLGYGLPTEANDQGDVYIGSIRSPADWSPDMTWLWLTSTLTKLGVNLVSK